MIKKLKARWMMCLFFLVSVAANGQPGPLTINQCYRLAKQNYPLIKQRELILRSRDYSIENIAKGDLPQFSVQGRASYQSEVTKLPIHLPNMQVPGLSKDQYRIYGTLTQNLYDGGVIRTQKQMQDARAKIADQQLEVRLYQLKDRINQLFFGILLLDTRLEQNDLLENDIRLGLATMRAAIENGVALKSNADILRAELLNADQDRTELKADRVAYSRMLSLFINREENDSLVLQAPVFEKVPAEIKRPELALFKYQHLALDVRNKMLRAKNLPKFNLFLQGGAGRPALNMLDNSFKGFYVGGVTMSIPLSGFYTLKKERALMGIDREKINTERETFLFNTRLTVTLQDQELQKLNKMLVADHQIIGLRDRVKTTALSQLQHGVINSNDYLKDVNAADLARQHQARHQVQRLMADYQQKTTTGN